MRKERERQWIHTLSKQRTSIHQRLSPKSFHIMISTIIIAFSTPVGIQPITADNVNICNCTTYPEEKVTQSHLNERTYELTVSGNMITDFTERIKQRQRRSHYINFISMYHSKVATTKTGRSLVNYWKRIRAQVWEPVSINEEYSLSILCFILIIAIQL